jgi:regulator of nucleoside diphosphate kinase
MTVTDLNPGSRPPVYVLDWEYDPLADLVCASERKTAGVSLLWEELERATVLPGPQAPPDLVRMGSRVYFTDLARRESKMVRLVYPSEASAPTLVSVTSSLGAALVGLRTGDEFAWTAADGELRRIHIDEVTTPSNMTPRSASLSQLLSEAL